MRRNSRRRGRSRFRETEDLNPMNYLSNLSDVMLILAVGIMLALVLHWNVNLKLAQENAQQEEQQQQQITTFEDDELSSMEEELPENAEHMGQVYYDPETGTYYVVGDTGSPQGPEVP